MATYYPHFNVPAQLVTDPAGKINYVYRTADGGPPNNGIPPAKPAPPPGPTYFGSFGLPSWQPPPPYQQVTQPSPFGPPPPPAPPPGGMSAPMPSAPRSLQAPPLSGNKVLGITPSFPGNVPSYIFSKYNVVIHLFHDNVINKYSRGQDATVYVPSYSNNMWTAHFVPCNMLISEFIEQIDCVKRANHHQPYPEYGIGIQELHEQEKSGVFTLGSRIMLNDRQAAETVGSIWPPGTGHAGFSRPPYLVRLPVCKYKSQP